MEGAAAGGAVVVIIDDVNVAVRVVVIGAAVTVATMGAVTVGAVPGRSLDSNSFGSRQLCLQGQRLLSLLSSYCSK